MHGATTKFALSKDPPLTTSGALQLRDGGLSLDFLTMLRMINSTQWYFHSFLIFIRCDPVHHNLSASQLQEVKETIDPLSDSDDFGIDIL